MCWFAELLVWVFVCGDWCVIAVFSGFCVALYLVCVVLLDWFGVWFGFWICVKLFTVACCLLVVVEVVLGGVCVRLVFVVMFV